MDLKEGKSAYYSLHRETTVEDYCLRVFEAIAFDCDSLE